MPQPADKVDAYQVFLDIPLEDQPPSFYRLLNLEDFEADTKVIEQASKERTAHLHQLSSGPNRDAVQLLLNEVAKARRTLLNGEAKQEYDAALTAKRATQSQHPAAIQLSVGQSKPTSERSKRKSKSPINDWRLHAVSATLLLLSAITFVVYRNSQATHLAAAPQRPETLPSKKVSRPALQTPPKKTRSLLDPAKWADAVAAMPSDSTPPTRSLQGGADPNESSTQSSTPTQPTAVTLQLSADWKQGLATVDDFATPLKNRYEIKSGEDLVTVREGRLVLLPDTSGSEQGTMGHKGSKLQTGQAIAITTNLPVGLSPDEKQQASRIGIFAGPLRLSLQSAKERLKIMMYQTELGEFEPVVGEPTTLVLLREQQAAEFRWIVVSGDRNLSGRATYAGPVSDQHDCGVFFRKLTDNTRGEVWLDDLYLGSLTMPPIFPDCHLVTVPPQPNPKAAGR
jgi:hypothetical protein